MSLEMCHLLLALKIIRKRAQICDRCSLENFAMLSRFLARGRTHDAGSITQIAFKHKHHFIISEITANNCFKVCLRGSISLSNCRFSCPRSF